MNFGQAIRILCRWYQPSQLYLRVGFSLPAQASFFLICTGVSAGTGYHPHIMPRTDMKLNNVAESQTK